ncbi:MAG: LPS assembly protein LptD, partial [Gammaproteobacteria bacterium]
MAAEEDWGLCSLPTFEYIETDDLAEGETRIEADQVASEDNQILHLVGDVSLTRRQLKLNADDVVLRKPSEQISARGNVVLEQPDLRLAGPGVEIDKLADTLSIDDAAFELPGRHARGTAGKIEKLDEYRSRFEELFYTACDPGDLDWHLRASELEIDDESGRGSATHTTIYFQEIPFIYLPYFQFPIDDRRLSGVLIPTVGYSEANGASLGLPVYWNIAPNYDMTITPVWFDKRGLQLNTENRYLFGSGRGQLDLSYLDDREAGDTRWFRQLRHVSNLGYDITGDLLLAEVSDGEIFDDFDNIAPEYNSIRHLERRVRFRRIGQIWDSQLMWQDYQTLDPATPPEDRPYSRLPRLAVEASPPPWQGGFETPLRTEIATFDREDSVTGTRSNLVGSLLWSSEDSWYFFKPRLQLAFTDYQLEDNPGDDNIDRALPTL